MMTETGCWKETSTARRIGLWTDCWSAMQKVTGCSMGSWNATPKGCATGSRKEMTKETWTATRTATLKGTLSVTTKLIAMGCSTATPMVKSSANWIVKPRESKTWRTTGNGTATRKALWMEKPKVKSMGRLTPKRTGTWTARRRGCQTAIPRRPEPGRRHCLAIVPMLPFQLVVSNIMLSKAHLSVDCNHRQHQIARTRG